MENQEPHVQGNRRGNGESVWSAVKQNLPFFSANLGMGKTPLGARILADSTVADTPVGPGLVLSQ